VGWRRQRIGDGDRAGEAELRDAAEAGEASRLASLGEVESRRTSNSSSGICSEPWEKWRPGSGRGYRERRCRRARAGGRSSGGESSDRQTRAERVGLLGRGGDRGGKSAQAGCHRQQQGQGRQRQGGTG
jgi:hypothetical protein